MHAKFTLKYSYVGSEDYSPVDVTFEIPGDATVDQMLFNFECFMKACGFVFDGKFVESTPEEKYEGCMADWDDEEGPSFHDNLSTAICEEARKKKSCCGLEDTSSPLETSEFNKQFDVTRTTSSSEDSISVEDYQKRRNWYEAEKMLKEWNEGIARLDNEQKQRCREEALKMSDLHYEATKEVVKNNWVHGMCNPPSPDWKKKK